MPWVKAYTEMLDDTKLLRLNDACCWRFMQLILLAGVCDAEGLLTTGTGPMSLDDIAVRLRVRTARLAPQMDALVNVGLVENTPHGYRVCKFSERQGRKQSEKREQWRAAASKSRQTGANSGPNWVQNDTDLTQVGAILDEKPSNTATKRKTSYENTTPRVEKSREENTKHAGEQPPAPAASEPDQVKELAAVFEQAAGVKLPEPSGEKAKKTVGVTWWHPLREMVKLANGNSEQLLRASITQLRARGLNVSSPQSCLKTFISLNGAAVTAGASSKFIDYS